MQFDCWVGAFHYYKKTTNCLTSRYRPIDINLLDPLELSTIATIFYRERKRVCERSWLDIDGEGIEGSDTKECNWQRWKLEQCNFYHLGCVGNDFSYHSSHLCLRRWCIQRQSLSNKQRCLWCSLCCRVWCSLRWLNSFILSHHSLARQKRMKFNSNNNLVASYASLLF